MSTYREIHGKAIKSLSTDPSDANVAGQVWYNTDSNTFKSVLKVEAWVSSAPLLQDYRQGGYAGDTQSSYMIFGGYPIPTNNNKTFEYNGSGWAAGGNLGTGKYLNGGAGTQTAGLDYGGYNGSAPITIPGGNVTQEYNGTAWSDASATMGTARYNCLGSGTQTAALSAAGISSPPANAPSANNNFSEEYNGSSWSEGNNLNTPRNVSGSQSGTQTAAIMFGGFAYPSSFKSDVENYDGTSWTSGTSLPAGRVRAGTSGTQTDALVYGGSLPSVTDTCLSWDGTTFSSVPSLATARQGGGNSQNAPSTGAVLAGGSPSPKTMTEEFNSSTNVITAGAWSSGGNLPQDSRGGGSAGTQNAGWYVGGLQYPSDTKNRTDEYDGASWTNVNNLPTNTFMSGACGTLTAGLIWGSNQGYGAEEQTYEYDGTNWTAGGSLPDIGPAYGSAGGGGTQTAAVACGGYGDPPPGVSQVMEYNGSSWTANPNSLPTGNYNQAGDGTSTALWLAGGYLSTTATLHFDGTSFSTSGSLTTARPSGNAAGYGIQTSAIVSGGDASGGLVSEQYNGTSWVTAPQMSQGRKYGNGASRSAGSLTGWQAGGATPPNPNTNKTEEFTPETTAVNVKTLTQS